MPKTKKIYVVGNQLHYANFITDHNLVDNIEDADIVIFTGGEDVHPSLYKCKPHPTTYANLQRDMEEVAEFRKIKSNQLVIGICRGSQFVCVMNGGKLVQNVTKHAIRHTHLITEIGTNKVYDITSTHHQMQYPFELSKNQYTCLFAAVGVHSDRYEGDGIQVPPFEPEIVLYKNPGKPTCLAIQGHPEYMRSDSPIVIRLNEIINTLLKHEN